MLNHIAHHVIARRRTYSAASWLLCIARTSRVLLYPARHRRLCALPLFSDYVAQPPNDDLFHHLSHRHYLAKRFGPRARVDALLTHYAFEDEHFDSAYKRAVYLANGLQLWEASADHVTAQMMLTMATRHNAEGDLTLTLRVDGQRLHRVSFSWFADGGGIVPYIARNQGHGPEEEAAFSRFNQAFPNNSPSYFCLAGMHGIAQAVGAQSMLGVSTENQIASRPRPGKFYANAYDGFWEIVGGTQLPDGSAWRLPSCFHGKPLAEMASKHRKRAAMRRAHWHSITDSCRATLQAHLRGDPPAPARAPA
ncbi:MAG: DUF535 family protein [Telluria sp.]